MNIIKLYMMQNILYFFVLLRQKYIVNQNRYASNHLYHQCDKVFQPAHFRQLCAITFFGGLRKNFLKKIQKIFSCDLSPCFPGLSAPCRRQKSEKASAAQALAAQDPGLCRTKAYKKGQPEGCPLTISVSPVRDGSGVGPMVGGHPRHVPDHAGNAPAKKP